MVPVSHLFFRTVLRLSNFAALLVCLLFTGAAAELEWRRPHADHHRPAFRPGEKLSYQISWSGLVSAGTATMEVREERTSAGRTVYRYVSSARSGPFISTFYPVNDIVQSVVDPEQLCSISYNVDQRHGSKRKAFSHTVDIQRRTALFVRGDQRETFPVPEGVQDALSSLYALRTMDSFRTDRPIVVPVFDSGKNWAVEVHTQGRERIDTVLGPVDTIRVVTYPKYEGVFQHKGEIQMWLTDDRRKIPVLMKSKIKIGSVMATLTGAVNIEDGK